MASDHRKQLDNLKQFSDNFRVSYFFPIIYSLKQLTQI